jgi:hypothetical protein
MEEYMERYE